jgi:hypothetical protein
MIPFRWRALSPCMRGCIVKQTQLPYTISLPAEARALAFLAANRHTLHSTHAAASDILEFRVRTCDIVEIT